MHSALDENGKLINLINGKPEKQYFSCPACKSEVILKSGRIKMPHFAHLSLKNCKSWSEQESFQHLSLKKELYLWASKTEKVEIEKYLPDLEQTPDLLINNEIAIEIQCSRLSIERLFERTRNYRVHHYKVIWLMGRDLWLKDRLSPLQKHLLYFSKNQGFHYWELDLEKTCVRLKYLIHQNLRGKIAYLTEEFPFGREEFLGILRRPFQAQKNQALSVEADGHLQEYIRQELYYCAPKWMDLQARYYSEGKNLLEEEISIYWTPIGLDLFTMKNEDDFCQVSENLQAYYEKFLKYYQKYQQKKLLAPAFYDKIYE